MRGEGVGLLLLKPLARAEADGDSVLAVLAGSAVAHGSNRSPITVPDARSQAAVYRRALARAGVAAREVGFVEAHGTATPVGDPIEFQALRRVFGGGGGGGDGRERTRTRRGHDGDGGLDLMVGSVKDNIGHAESASGVASVIKAILMLKHKTIPAQAGFVTMNPRIPTCKSDRISIATRTMPWNLVEGGPSRRVALINNYGAAGSNAAIVVEEYAPPPAVDCSDHERHEPGTTEGSGGLTALPVVLSANSTASLRSNALALATHLDANRGLSPDLVAINMARRQNVSSHQHRAAFTAVDMPGMISGLRSIAADLDKADDREEQAEEDSSDDIDEDHGHEPPPVDSTRRPVVLCFGGQVGWMISVPTELLENSTTTFKRHWDECQAACSDLTGLSLDCFTKAGDGDNDRAQAQTDPVLQHCALFSLQYASARAWIDSGLPVATVVGHSLGQFAATCIAGRLSLRDALVLVAGRARLVRDKWPEDRRGAMLAVECDREDLDAALGDILPAVLDVACYNGPRSFVVSGDRDSVEAFERACGQLQTRQQRPQSSKIKTKLLRNSHAFHSRLVDSILPDLEQLARTVTIYPMAAEASIQLELTHSADGASPVLSAQDIVDHTRQPVYWDQAIRRIATKYPQGATWLEAGSSTPIIAMTKRILASSSSRGHHHVFVSVDLSTGTKGLSDVACRLWRETRLSLVFWPFHQVQQNILSTPGGWSRYALVNLPSYQFEKTRHWIEYKSKASGSSSADMNGVVKAPGRDDPPVLLVSLGSGDGDGSEMLFRVNTRHPVFVQAVEGHVVAGAPLCPATMYVELAAVCCARSHARGNQERNGHDERVVYSTQDLAMLAPLGLDHDISVYCSLVVENNRSGSGPKLNGSTQPNVSYTFSIFSQVELPSSSPSSSAPRREHARGRLNFRTKTKLMAISNDDSSIQEAQAMMKRLFSHHARPEATIQSLFASTFSSSSLEAEPAVIGSAAVYNLFGNVVRYAEPSRGIKGVKVLPRHNDREKLAVGLVDLPRSASGLGGLCNMVLVDNFIQVAGIHVNCLDPSLSSSDGGHVFVCDSIHNIVWTSDGLMGSASDPDPVDGRGLWTVYTSCRHDHLPSVKSVSCDIFAFRGSNSSATAVPAVTILGATFQRVQRRSLAMALSRGKAHAAAEQDSSQAQKQEQYQLIRSSNATSSTHNNALDKSAGAGRTTATASISAQVRSMFSNLLQIPISEIRLSTTFDQLGVDSLLATEVLADIEKRFGVRWTAVDFQEFENVRELSQRLESILQQQKNGHIPQENLIHQHTTHPTSFGLDVLCREACAQLGQNKHTNGTAGPDQSDSSSDSASEVALLESKLVTKYIVHALATVDSSCDLRRMEPGQQVPIVAHHTNASRLVSRLYKHLQDAGLLFWENDRWRRSVAYVSAEPEDDEIEAAAAAGATDDSLSRPLARPSEDGLEEARQFPEQHRAEVALLHGVAYRGLASFLQTGRRLEDSHEICALVDRFYSEAPRMRRARLLQRNYLAQVFRRLINSAPDIDATAGQEEIRILELGGIIVDDTDTVGSSVSRSRPRYLVELLEAELLESGKRKNKTDDTPILRIRWTIAYRSSRAMVIAKEDCSLSSIVSRLANIGVCLDFTVLDSQQVDASLSGLSHSLGTWDFIISAPGLITLPTPDGDGGGGCLVRDFGNSTSSLRKLLRSDDGVLCLVEPTQNSASAWSDLVWGLVDPDSWWSRNWASSATGAATATAVGDEDSWVQALNEAGCGWVDCIGGSDTMSLVLATPRGAADFPTVIQRQLVRTKEGKQAENVLCEMETVAFKEIDGVTLHADIFYPKTPDPPGTRPRPIALMVHGGGHVFYTRKDIRPDQRDLLLDLGFLPLTIDYRKCPEVTLLDGPMADAASALEWARRGLPGRRQRLDDVAADPANVVAIGWSSGGHVALSLAWTAAARGLAPPQGVLGFYCATDYADPAFRQPLRPAGSERSAARYHGYALTDDIWDNGLFDRPVTGYYFATNRSLGWRRTDARARLVLHMNWHGTTLDVLLNGMDKRAAPRRPPPRATPAQTDAVSPLAQIRAGAYASPTFLVHAGADDHIPVEQARRTYAALRAHRPDLRAGLSVVEGAIHAFDAYPGFAKDPAAKAAVEDGYAFLCECVGFVWDRERVQFRPFAPNVAFKG